MRARASSARAAGVVLAGAVVLGACSFTGGDSSEVEASNVDPVTGIEVDTSSDSAKSALGTAGAKSAAPLVTEPPLDENGFETIGGASAEADSLSASIGLEAALSDGDITSGELLSGAGELYPTSTGLLVIPGRVVRASFGVNLDWNGLRGVAVMVSPTDPDIEVDLRLVDQDDRVLWEATVDSDLDRKFDVDLDGVETLVLEARSGAGSGPAEVALASPELWY